MVDAVPELLPHKVVVDEGRGILIKVFAARAWALRCRGCLRGPRLGPCVRHLNFNGEDLALVEVLVRVLLPFLAVEIHRVVAMLSPWMWSMKVLCPIAAEVHGDEGRVFIRSPLSSRKGGAHNVNETRHL